MSRPRGDHSLRTISGGNVAGVGDRLASRANDLFHKTLRRAAVRVVYHDGCAFRANNMLAARPASCPAPVTIATFP